MEYTKFVADLMSCFSLLNLLQLLVYISAIYVDTEGSLFILVALLYIDCNIDCA